MTLQPSAMREIRVLLVEDSPLSIELIRRVLAAAPDIVVVGTAGDGLQALALIPEVRPDVICTDLHMPRMDGVALTLAVMARHPLPILALSVSLQADQSRNIFRMLEAGALDIMAKPHGGLQADFGVVADDLIRKIRIVAGVKVIGRRRVTTDAIAQALPPSPSSPRARMLRIIGIGASTGGPQALERILRQLPADFPLPLLCIQHIVEGFMQGMVAWLAGCCRIRVCTAEAGARPRAGIAYFPPDGSHLEINEEGAFRCSSALSLAGHRPSVDIAFSSLARAYGGGAAGVLLTGMGTDGAQGMLDIARAGGLTIAQDQQSSVVFGMPARAIELGAVHHVLPLEQIAPALIGVAGDAETSRKAAGAS